MGEPSPEAEDDSASHWLNRVISTNVRREAERLGYSRADLAEKTGRAVSGISFLWTGRRGWTIIGLTAFAEAVRRPPWQLLRPPGPCGWCRDRPEPGYMCPYCGEWAPPFTRDDRGGRLFMSRMSGLAAIDLFAGGGGGWDLAAGEALGGGRVAGLELDPSACLTRAAAGLRTIRTDVAAFPAGQLAGRIAAIAGSPPCTTFTQAGSRAALRLMAILAGLIRDLLAGRDTRAERIAGMEAALAASDWAAGKPNRGHRITVAVRMAALVAEPGRYIAAVRPEWIAMEQVREVLPLWQVYAAGLRELGYSAWCGNLVAADYGVPTTRTRAILIASSAREVYEPAATHYDPRKGIQPFYRPWVTMHEALGWGLARRPAPTVTAGGTATGGAEPFGRRSREMMLREMLEGGWVLRIDAQSKAVTRQLDEPAQTIKAGHSAATEAAWVSPEGEIRAAEPWELGILQSFPADWPWRGTRTAQFRQVGNTMPPGLARAVLAVAAGRALDLAA